MEAKAGLRIAYSNTKMSIQAYSWLTTVLAVPTILYEFLLVFLIKRTLVCYVQLWISNFFNFLGLKFFAKFSQNKNYLKSCF